MYKLLEGSSLSNFPSPPDLIGNSDGKLMGNSTRSGESQPIPKAGEMQPIPRIGESQPSPRSAGTSSHFNWTRLCLILPLALIISCSGVLREQQQAATDALDSLEKVSAATQVGVTYLKYRELLIEAKNQVNRADRTLKPGPLKTAILASMEAYSDAADTWKAKVDLSAYSLNPKSGFGQKLVERYSVPSDRFADLIAVGVATQLIWKVADERLDEAATAFGRPRPARQSSATPQ